MNEEHTKIVVAQSLIFLSGYLLCIYCLELVKLSLNLRQ